MNNPDIKSFIKKHSTLFWYVPEKNKTEISKELLVEPVLNYGSMEDVLELFEIMGIEQVARVFFSARGRKKLNYYPEIYNYFSLLFRKYA